MAVADVPAERPTAAAAADRSAMHETPASFA